MEDLDQELNRQSPNRLLTNFSKGYLLIGILVTLVVHAVLIGSTSMGYIRDKWIDPEGAAKREADKKRQLENEAAVESRTNATASVLSGKTNAPAATATNKAPDKPVTAPDSSGIPADLTNSPMIKRLNEVAKPEDLPKLDSETSVKLDEPGIR